MKLNSEANQIRNLNLSSDKQKDIEQKEKMIKILKKDFGYKKNLKLSKSKRKRWAIIQDQAAGDETKIILLKELLYNETEIQNSELCPFLSHKGYASLWKKISPQEQKKMKENIKITSDNKIEFIKLKKKFSLLDAQPDGINILDGSSEDNHGKLGSKGSTYFVGNVIKTTALLQNKKILDGYSSLNLFGKHQIPYFFDFIPGDSLEERILNFVLLFDLKKTGFWSSSYKGWQSVDISGAIGLSCPDLSGDVRVICWGNKPEIDKFSQKNPIPYLVYEDV